MLSDEIDILTHSSRMAAYRVDLFAEIEDLKDELETLKLQKTLSMALNLLLVIVLLLISAGPAQASAIYKCQTGGKVIFQKSSCPDVDAKPLDLKQPSPLLLLKIRHEAALRQIDEDYREIQEQKEAEHQAELNAITAREHFWNQMNLDIQISREKSDRRQVEWNAQDRCRNRRVISSTDDC